MIKKMMFHAQMQFSYKLNKKLFYVLVSLFNGNIRRLFNSKANLRERDSKEIGEIHTFAKSICPKGNVIVRLELEYVYHYIVVQHVNHYTPRIATIYFKRHALIKNLAIICCFFTIML